MDEEQARKQYVTIQSLRKQQQSLHERLEELDDKMTELQEMMRHVEQAATLEEGEDILVPLTSGVFIPAKTAKIDTIYLNVGGGAVIEKDPASAKLILTKQQEELEAYRQTLKTQAEKVSNTLKVAEEQAAQNISKGE